MQYTQNNNRQQKENNAGKRMEEGGASFKTAMLAINNQLNIISETNEKVTLLRSIRKAVISDLALSSINSLLYTGRSAVWEDRSPYLLTSKTREPYYKLMEGTYVCDLRENRIVSYPWHIGRYCEALLIIAKKGFRYMPDNHKIDYYPQLDLYVAYNGLHSISAGVLAQEGTLTCDNVYDLTKMFEQVHTDDGLTWVDADGFSVGSISDFKFALIFEISKLLMALECHKR